MAQLSALDSNATLAEGIDRAFTIAPTFPHQARYIPKISNPIENTLFQQDKGKELQARLKLIASSKSIKNAKAKAANYCMAFIWLSILADKKCIFKQLCSEKEIIKKDKGFERVILHPYALAKNLLASKCIKEMNRKLPKSFSDKGNLLSHIFTIANIWKTNSPVKIGKNSVNPYGGFSRSFLTIIEAYSRATFKGLAKKDSKNSRYYLECYKSISYMKNALFDSEKNLLRKIFKGEVVSLPISWKGHELNLSFLKTKKHFYMAITNRGQKGRGGIEIYRIDRSIEQKEFIKLLRPILKTKASSHYITSRLRKSLKAKRCLFILHQGQKLGNCSWINNMTAVHTIMILNKLKSGGQFEKDFLEIGDIIRRKKARNRSFDEFKDQLIFMRRIYKSLNRKIKQSQLKSFLKKHGNDKLIKDFVAELRAKENLFRKKKVPSKKGLSWEFVKVII
ncbi:MAG: hypothetical protein L7U87_01955 [Chlamydiales bacterium]|nr:hypothetical protein [Chlamydiales bacterium]